MIPDTWCAVQLTDLTVGAFPCSPGAVPAEGGVATRLKLDSDWLVTQETGIRGSCIG